MYYTIKNSAADLCADYKFSNDCLILDGENVSSFWSNKNKYIVSDNKLVLNPNYEAELAQKERERIALLNMTKADFWLAALEKGITKQDVLAKIELLPDEKQRTKALIRFEDANNYWRGDEFMDVIGAMFGITPDELDYLFEHKQFLKTESEEK